MLYFRQNLVPLSDIMILSPYRAQVTTIRNLISKERSDLKDVHVGTVVTSQGRLHNILLTTHSGKSLQVANFALLTDQANKNEK